MAILQEGEEQLKNEDKILLDHDWEEINKWEESILDHNECGIA